MKLRYLTSLLFVSLLMVSCDENKDDRNLTQFVNPFIGTGGHGHTYPGASTPFGMVQLSPDTRLEGWDGCGGYHYTDSVVYGFSHTHLSGTGISDYGDVLLMPTSGDVQLNNGYGTSPDQGYASRFSHNKEQASPGYYEVHLDDYNIDVSLTVSPRAGFHQYSFHNEGLSNIILDLEHRDRLSDVALEVVNTTTVKGKRISRAWATEQHVYFYMEFSKPFIKDTTASLLFDGIEKTTKAAFTFNTLKDEIITVKVGISAVSEDGAKANLEAEIPHWDFAQTRKEANDAWNKKLHKIEVESDEVEKKTIFYTALYHSLLNPNLYMDVDGHFRGMDLKVHQTDKFVNHTVFSLWDTFRAAHPLFTIIEQEKTNDFINTFLNQYQIGSILPIWELAGNYTGCMIGYHGISVIADAYAKGINGYDANMAFEAMKHSANQDHLGLKYYKADGFISGDQEAESVSKTLEYAYDDWCIAQMAKALGQTDDYVNFSQRGQFYKNIFDNQTGFMRAKMEGNWFAPFDPTEVNFNYTEANSWQYSLFAPQDVQGLIDLYGGAAHFETKLDQLFETESALSGREQADITGLIGQYAHGNEPSHHMAYLYNFIGKPEKTQLRVKQILNTMYHNAPEGLSGNEDCGQMSAWYVMSAMGFYPVTPGLPYYVIGTPLFDKVTLNLENGKQFVITANNVSDENSYIQSAQLNGKEYKASYLDHNAIMAGGSLAFEMSNAANPNSFEVSPISAITENKITPVPYFEATSKTFTDSLVVTIGSADPAAQLFYQIGDSTFVAYTGSVTIKNSAEIKAYASREAANSFTVTTHYYKIDGGRTITLGSEYANQYAAGGQIALIDYLRGGDNYRTGTWQGYQGQDLKATVDLGEVKQINTLGMGFLQDVKSWIWFPKQVVFEVSMDGKTFKKLPAVVNDFPDDKEGGFTKDFNLKTAQRARYVRVTAQYYGDCPAWHLGAGGTSWLFADEIIVE